MKIRKELDWLLGVVGPVNIAVSCRLSDTSTLHRWVSGDEIPDERGATVISLLYNVFHRLLLSGLRKDDVCLFFQSSNDDFFGCSPVVFLRENDPSAFRTRFFKHFDRVRMERLSGEVFARAGNYGLSKVELDEIVDAGNLGVVFHLTSAASAVYDSDGVETLLRSNYSGVTGKNVVDLLRSSDATDIGSVYEIIERIDSLA